MVKHRKVVLNKFPIGSLVHVRVSGEKNQRLDELDGIVLGYNYFNGICYTLKVTKVFNAVSNGLKEGEIRYYHSTWCTFLSLNPSYRERKDKELK